MRNIERKNMRKKQLQRRITGFFLIILVAAAITITALSVIPAKGGTVNNKYYKSIKVESGDTLWTIADEYMTGGDCSRSEYIEEIKSMNGLTDETIHAGKYIVICYWN
ncbi:MAG: LysM peptidoglycan-binding domain-containing protein [Eubacterium sp.]